MAEKKTTAKKTTATAERKTTAARKTTATGGNAAAAGDVRAGDLVRIQESRPFSATKHWQVVEVLSRAGEAGAAAPRAADIEKLLEQAEGVDTILVPQREEKAEPVVEETAE